MYTARVVLLRRVSPQRQRDCVYIRCNRAERLARFRIYQSLFSALCGHCATCAHSLPPQDTAGFAVCLCKTGLIVRIVGLICGMFIDILVCTYERYHGGMVVQFLPVSGDEMEGSWGLSRKCSALASTTVRRAHLSLSLFISVGPGLTDRRKPLSVRGLVKEQCLMVYHPKVY